MRGIMKSVSISPSDILSIEKELHKMTDDNNYKIQNK